MTTTPKPVPWPTPDEMSRIRSAITTDDDGCWIWQRGTNNGCPCATVRSRSVSVRRVLLLVDGNEQPGRRKVEASCGKPLCVRPACASGPGRRPHRTGSQHPLAVLDESDVREIKRRLRSGESRQRIARSMEVGRTSIDKIAQGRAWRHVKLTRNEEAWA